MWIQNHAVFMKTSPMQHVLQAERTPVTLKYIQVTQVKVPLYSHQNQNHIQIKANKILSIVRRAEKQGSYLNLIVSVEITASTSRKASSYMICQKKIKLLFFIINWKIKLNPTEPKSQKIVYDSYYQFTHSLLWFFSILRVPCYKSKKVLTVNYL